MTQDPDTIFRLVRLALAREAGHPEGDLGHSYRLVLPLRPDGRIDEAAFRAEPERCRVVREDEDQERIGRLHHGPGGRWSFTYLDEKNSEDIGFRFETERFVPGEYVSLSRDDGQHTYRVVSQQPL